MSISVIMLCSCGLFSNRLLVNEFLLLCVDIQLNLQEKKH